MTTLSAALVHHPVLDRTGEIVTTAVTNIDVHDLARSCRTYDLRALWIVTPITAQRELVSAILSHWDTGDGRRRSPTRWSALQRVRVAASLEEVLRATRQETARELRVVATAARSTGRTISSYAAERAKIAAGEELLLLFGTGHGLADSALDLADVLLPPIEHVQEEPYNHLSVRAATAITLDRLMHPSQAS